MAHSIYIFLGKIYWIFRIIYDYLSDYIFGFVYNGKHHPLPAIKNPLLLENASRLALRIRTKQVRSEDVIKAYIDRIHEVNIIINAVVDERFADAILEAQKADCLIESGTKSVEELEQQLPFLGVPFTTKECISVKGLHQSCGLVSRKTYISDTTAPVIQQMMDSGAILLGVCNIAELISFAESHNHVYGVAKNPYDIARNTGGSSGGDGAIISACGSLFSIGTDIGGSIRIPSLCNGIFGHKTTRGCTNLDGMIPPNDGDVALYNTIGPMCRFAEDLIPLYKCMLKSPEIADKLQLDKHVDFRNLKIFYIEELNKNDFFSPIDPEIKNAMRKAMAHFERMYGIKAIKADFNELNFGAQIYGSKIKRAADALNVSMSSSLADGKGKVNGVLEFIKALFFRSNHTLDLILVSMFEKIMNTDEEFVRDVDAKYDSLKSKISDALGSDGVLFLPTQPKPAPYHHQTLLIPLNFVYTGMMNMLGFPSTHCTMGLNSRGLPIGFQVVSNFYNDRLSLNVAKQLGREFGGWVPPCPVEIELPMLP